MPRREEKSTFNNGIDDRDESRRDSITAMGIRLERPKLRRHNVTKAMRKRKRAKPTCLFLNSLKISLRPHRGKEVRFYISGKNEMGEEIEEGQLNNNSDS